MPTADTKKTKMKKWLTLKKSRQHVKEQRMDIKFEIRRNITVALVRLIEQVTFNN